MAALAEEGGAIAAADREHAAACAACHAWLTANESLGTRLGALEYRRADVDLWSSVAARIEQADRRAPLVALLWPIGALVLAWRPLELLIELPMPALQPLVPIVAAAVAAWRIGGDFLAIETVAPELGSEEFHGRA
jgi:hypothetical protein